MVNIDMGYWYAKLSGGPHRVLNELSLQACRDTDVIKLDMTYRPLERPIESVIISFRKKKPRK
jgi:hypothetical protein